MKTKYTTPSDVTVEIEVITPAAARKMLEGNTDNRKLRSHRVSQYSDAMKRGMWTIQNDAITISKSGKLLNGQHRLTAIIEANETCQCIVLRGVDDDTYATIDSGLSRTVNDSLVHAGVGTNATHMSPVAKTLIALEAGISIFDTAAMALVQRQDIVDHIKTNQEMMDWALIVGRRADTAVGGIRHAWSVFAYMMGKKHGQEKVEEFVELVISGVGLKAGDAPLALRNWLTRQRGAWSRKASKTNIATFSSAFNKWTKGQNAAVIRPWDGTFEDFQEIVA